MNKPLNWYIHSNAVHNENNTSVSISRDINGRRFEITLLPTVSLAVWLDDETAKKERSNHKIMGTLQLNTEKDFDILWEGLLSMLAENGLVYSDSLKFASVVKEISNNEKI